MSDNRTKTIAIRVTDQEFEMYKKIAVSLHNQTFYDDTIKQHRPILQTLEPAEVLRFAMDGFVERYTNPKYHHVIIKLDQPAFQKWSTYAHNLSHSPTRDFFTGKPTKVLESPSLLELAFVDKISSCRLLSWQRCSKE